MREVLQNLLTRRVKQSVGPTREIVCEKMERKKEVLANHDRRIVQLKAVGQIIQVIHMNDEKNVKYQVHFQYLLDHHGDLYIEEEIENRQAIFHKQELLEDKEILVKEKASEEFIVPMNEDFIENEGIEERVTFHYDRLQAVKYAERWWNEFNPAYPSFTEDCTNYISQCLHAGGAPMIGYPNRSRGWWMRNHNWSYSWTVANSLANYLPKAKVGVRATVVSDPRELELGDVICYDFQGDGRFDHVTFVTGKDKGGYPLVNAHTANSRLRYWSYEDSTAYTPNIKYKFLHIVDDQHDIIKKYKK